MAQTPDANDLILVSDTGKIFLIKMKKSGNGNVPDKISELPAAISEVPAMLRDDNVTLAILPDEPTGGGCTCTLLNLQSIKPALRPSMTQTQASLVRARQAAASGKRIAIHDDDDGSTEELAFGSHPAAKAKSRAPAKKETSARKAPAKKAASAKKKR